MDKMIVNILGEIALLVLLGFFLKRFNIIDDVFEKKISRFLLNIILPISVLASANREFSKELSIALVQVACISVLYYIFSIFLTIRISKKLNTDMKHRGAFIIMCVFANVGFIGYPVMSQLYGSEGVLCAVIYNISFQIFLFTYGINLLSGEGKFEIRRLLSTPVTVASFVAIIIFLSPFRYPYFIAETLNDIGAMMVPLSMIIIGCSLADIKMFAILKDKYSYLVSGLRLVIFPILMMIVLSFMDITKIAIVTCVILTALPSGSLNVILAKEYECAAEFASVAVVQSMILMAITFPIIMISINIIF
jgi:predicted permease